MKPLILLDVDGVLNATPSDASDQDHIERLNAANFGDYQSRQIMGYRITWSTTVVDAVNEWHTSADIFWLTTWEDNARDRLAPELRLDRFPVIHESETDDHVASWWKLQGAQQKWDAERRPFVWLDDDLNFEFEAHRWLGTLPTDSWLMSAPDPYTGLEATDLQEVGQFLESHS